MEDRGENQIRKLFDELKEHDRRSAPSFQRVLEGKRPGSRSVRAVPLGMAAALAALVMAAVSLWVFRGAGPEPAEASLSAWRAPTDFLLVLPANELLRQPRVLESEPLPQQEEAPKQ